jgi:hypothetical protein
MPASLGGLRSLGVREQWILKMDKPDNETSMLPRFPTMLDLLLKQQAWGPLLAIGGVFALFTRLQTGRELG